MDDLWRRRLLDQPRSGKQELLVRWLGASTSSHGFARLSGEIFHQTSFATGGPGSPVFPLGSKDTTGFNLGGTYDFDQNHHLLFSAGRALQNASTTNAFSYYLALQWTF